MQKFGVLIVGGGHAGASAAAALRQSGFPGTVAIICDEPFLPYERPPLSKDYLAQERPFERILLRPETYWRERAINLLLGERVTHVDSTTHVVGMKSGKRLAYGSLIWAAGGSARRLSCAGGDLAGVHTIRSRQDVDEIISELPSIRRVVIIGGGYIGLEAAAVLSKLGKQITVLEALDRVLARVAAEPLSRFYETEHRTHGIDLRLGAAVDCIAERDGRAASVKMRSGEQISADLIIVGIGITPSVAPLLQAGALGGDGVNVDSYCQTSLPDIYAIGDCARHRNAFAGDAEIRLESVQNANDQALIAAKAICGIKEAYNAPPWFWSNQYDLKLQTIGLSLGYDEIVIRGDPAERSFSVVYLKEGRVVCLDCVNRTKDYIQGKALVLAKAVIAPAYLADANRPLKALPGAT